MSFYNLYKIKKYVGVVLVLRFHNGSNVALVEIYKTNDSDDEPAPFIIIIIIICFIADGSKTSDQNTISVMKSTIVQLLIQYLPF